MMRRIIDLLFAILWLVLTAPLMTLIGILIKIGSPGPMLYTPRMVGQNGRIFSLYRFRTMSTTASRQNGGPRFTRVGKAIRTVSLDHLPMLINLLKGDLTLVGPRPMEIQVVDRNDLVWQKYLRAKPGIFNYAVIQLGKLWTPARTTHPDANQRLEIEYQEKRTAYKDIQLVLKYLKGFVDSRGNIKARGKPDPVEEKKLSKLIAR